MAYVRIKPIEPEEVTKERMKQELEKHMERVQRDRIWNGVSTYGFKQAAIHSPAI